MAEPTYSSGDDYVVEFLGYHFSFNTFDFEQRVTAAAGPVKHIEAIVRIDTPEELTAFRHGGILPYVLRQLTQN